MTDFTELKENDLKDVSGGGYAVPSDHYEGVTLMHCDKCSWEFHWQGDYMNGQMYDCPHCKKHKLHGSFWAHYV